MQSNSPVSSWELPRFAETLSRTVDRLVIFAGAGVSIDPPASAPSFDHLRSQFLRAALDSLRLPGSHALRAELLGDERVSFLKPEVFFQAVHEITGDELFSALKVLALGRPNRSHRWLCKVARRGSGIILTTNFEHYFEEADPGLKSIHNTDFEKAMPSERPLIWHLHGSLKRPQTIQITLRQVARKTTSASVTAGLRQILQSFPMLVMGYSGRDDDVFPVLHECGTNGKGQALYWLVHPSAGSEINGPVAQLMDTWRARACIAIGTVEGLSREINARIPEIPSIDELKCDVSVNSAIPFAEHLRRWAATQTEGPLWRFLGHYALSIGRNETARHCLRQSTSFYERQGDSRLAAIALSELGTSLLESGNYDSASAALAEARERFAKLGLEESEGAAAHELGRIAFQRAEFDDATRWFIRARDLRERTDDQEVLALGVHALASIDLEKGRFPLAEEKLLCVIAIRERLGDRKGMGEAYHELGRVYQYQSDYKRAEDCYRKSLQIRESLALDRSYAPTLFKLGEVEMNYKHNLPAARDLFKRSLEAYRSEGNQLGIADCLNNLGLVEAFYQDWIAATNYLNGAAEIFEAHQHKAYLLRVYHNLAKFAIQQGLWEVALEKAIQSERLSRQCSYSVWTPQAIGLLGIIYHRCGDYRTARAYLEESWNGFEAGHMTGSMLAKNVKEALESISGISIP